MIKSVVSLCLILFVLSVSAEEIIQKNISYKDGKTQLAGHLFHQKNTNLAAAPVIVIVHNWLGVTEETLDKARDMADAGYVAFVADIYGKDSMPKDENEAGKIAGSYKNNLPLLRRRVELAIKEAKKIKSKNIFIAGYCFGGTAAIEYARSGTKDISGIISFHGGLYPSVDDKKIKTEILVLHGAVDPAVTKVDLEGMLKSFDENKLNYEFVSFAKAVHSFTDKTKVGAEANSVSAYNQKADERSWKIFKDFLNELSK